MRYKRFLYFISDASLITLSLILAFVLRFGFDIPPAYARDLFFLLPLVLATKIFVFKAFGFHNQLWRYASLKEGLRLVNGISASSLLILAVLFFFRRVGVPRAVIVIDWFLTLVLIGGCYFLARVRGELCSAVAARGQSLKKVVIVGAGDVGSSLARQMQKRPEKGYKPVAFLDDDPSKRGLMIHGIEVAGGSGAIPSVIAEHPADEVIIAIPSVGHRERMRIAIECEEIGIPYKVVPNLIELVNGKVKLSQIRKVDVKELLGREEVGINLKDAENCYRDKTVLITGAAGSIGSELCRQAMTLKPARVIAADISENGLYELEEKMAIRQDGDRAAFEVRLMNVKDELAVDRIISRYRPQIVFHAAAYKQVPMMERHALEVMENNFLGTRVMIDAARRYLVDRFVFISTDKAVNPRSIMGLSKQFGEKALKVAASGAPKTRFIAVRFGNVLGSSGSVIPKFKRQIRNGEPVTVTHPETVRYFMTVQEAVYLVMQATAMGTGGEIFVLDMGDPVRVVDLAKSIIRMCGYEPGRDVPIVFTGLRPGEKLREELFAKEEVLGKTEHPKIYEVIGSFDPAQSARVLDELEKMVRSGDDRQLRDLMREISVDRAVAA